MCTFITGMQKSKYEGHEGHEGHSDYCPIPPLAVITCKLRLNGIDCIAEEYNHWIFTPLLALPQHAATVSAQWYRQHPEELSHTTLREKGKMSIRTKINLINRLELVPRMKAAMHRIPTHPPIQRLFDTITIQMMISSPVSSTRLSKTRQ